MFAWPTDDLFTLEPKDGLTMVLFLLTVGKEWQYRRADARARDSERKRRDEHEVTASIIKERAELADENRCLRVDMRKDIERLKDELFDARKAIEYWRNQAEERQRRYEESAFKVQELTAKVETLQFRITDLEHHSLEKMKG